MGWMSRGSAGTLKSPTISTCREQAGQGGKQKRLQASESHGPACPAPAAAGAAQLERTAGQPRSAQADKAP